MAETDDLEALIGRIPERPPSTTTPNLRCCCGRADCAYLKHNCSALDDLEQEVRTAAQLGQVCKCLFSLFSPCPILRGDYGGAEFGCPEIVTFCLQGGWATSWQLKLRITCSKD